MNRKVYISGPITGTNDYERRFKRAVEFLEFLGDFPVNPVELVKDETWEDCMKEDIKLLLDCDTIFMLNGFEKSKGAMLEFNLACSLGMTILFEA